MKKNGIEAIELEEDERLPIAPEDIVELLDRCERRYEEFYRGRLEQYQLLQSEYGRTHDSSRVEQELVNLVKAGDVERLRDGLKSQVLSAEMKDMGLVARDLQKRMEYYTVSLLTILSRAAVEAGVSREQSYELSDLFLLELTECSDIENIVRICLTAELAFTKLVREEKRERKDPHIEACKDYISKNLRRNFRIAEIGPAIGVNSNYLSQKFSRQEGITISQYVTRERLQHAANLLKYSDYEIGQIAEYFCFSSQSYFGEQFRKEYQMSPGQYRQLYV